MTLMPLPPNQTPKPLSASNPVKPAQRFAPQQLSAALKKQSWVVLFAVILGTIIDLVFTSTGQFTVAKNMLAGALVAWVGQLAFSKVALSVSGFRQRRQIVHRLYIGHMVKWLISLLGFALIFNLLRPLAALWVFAGFMLLQASYIGLMYRFRPQS